jgi:hypothetical protein
MMKTSVPNISMLNISRIGFRTPAEGIVPAGYQVEE